MKIDCGSNSCHFAPKGDRGGMRTNSGCTCFDNAGFGRSAIQAAYKMLPELLKLREENKKLKEEIQGMHEDAAGEDI